MRLLSAVADRRPRLVDVAGEDEFVSVCREADDWWHVYVGVNERISAGGAGVVSINNVLFDIDPGQDGGKRPLYPGNLGTLYAIQAAQDLAVFCMKEGIHNYPVVACSGNGAYVWLATPPIAPGDSAERQSLRLGLRKLAVLLQERVADRPVKIDLQVTADIARIIRVIGTRNLKGATAAPEDGVEARWTRMSFWVTTPERHESEWFWPYLENLKETYRPREVNATYILPAPSHEILRYLYDNCHRLRGLSGQDDRYGQISELGDYELWLYFGVNMVKACGALGAQEWLRVSESAPGFNPEDWDAHSPFNKVAEAARFAGPPNCDKMKCPVLGSCPVKSPAGWAAKYAGALRMASRDPGGIYVRDETNILSTNIAYHTDQFCVATHPTEQEYHRRVISSYSEQLQPGALPG
jgi:hypothetical protein